MKRLTYVYCVMFCTLIYVSSYASCHPDAYTWYEKRLPHFALPDEENISHSLGEFTGKWLVVCFLPDDTENRIDMAYLAEAYAPFVHHNIDVVCISYEPVSELKRIKEWLSLPFMLLSDAAYNVSERLINPYFDRATFIINPEGLVKKVIVTPRVEYHIAEILLFFIKNGIIARSQKSCSGQLPSPRDTLTTKSLPSSLVSHPILPFCLPDEMSVEHNFREVSGKKFILSFL